MALLDLVDLNAAVQRPSSDTVRLQLGHKGAGGELNTMDKERKFAKKAVVHG